MTAATMAPESARERATRDALLPAALEAATRGDERAFMLLYHWRARAVSACVRLGVPESRVRITVREVFRKAWHGLPRSHAREAVEFDVWLLRELAPLVEAQWLDVPLSAQEIAVWDLPIALREVVLLRDAFGRGLDQVAPALGQPVETVRLWYKRGIESLADTAEVANPRLTTSHGTAG